MATEPSAPGQVAAPSYAGGAADLLVGDFNGDGIPDLLVQTVPTTLPGGPASHLVTMLGNGDGTFTALPNPPLVSGEYLNLAAADFNKDGKLDVVYGENVGQNIFFLPGKGDGTFGSSTQIATTSGVLSIGASDLNGDGNIDLVLSSQSPTMVAILLGRGDGTFRLLPDNPALDLSDFNVGISDVTGDGIPDLVLADYYGAKLRVFQGLGDGTFTFLTGSPIPSFEESVSFAFADFNGDGHQDLAVSYYPNSSLDASASVLLSNAPTSSALATLANVSPVGTGTHYIEITYTGDAYNAAATSLTIPLLAQPVPTTLTLSASPTAAAPNQPITLTASLNQFFAQNHNAAGPVTFTSNGQPLGTAPVANGTASLTLNSLPSGALTLAANYMGDTNFTASTSNAVPFNVNPAGTTPQTITFPPLATPAYAATSVILTATASSGLPVTYTVVSGPATVTGSTLTYTGAGVVTIEADQAGTANYTAAAPVRQTVTPAILTEPVGTTSPIISTVVTFTAPGTLASVAFLTQGARNLDFMSVQSGSVNGPPACIPGTTYATGQTCTIAFTFKPTIPGIRYGGISFTAASGAVLASTYLEGLGIGPLVNYLPGTQSTFFNAVLQPAGLAFDAAGNLFIADARGMAVYESNRSQRLQESPPHRFRLHQPRKHRHRRPRQRIRRRLRLARKNQRSHRRQRLHQYHRSRRRPQPARQRLGRWQRQRLLP